LFPHTASADNNVFLLPNTTLYQGESPCTNKDSKTCYEFLEPLPVIDENGKNAEATAIEIIPEQQSIGKSFNNFYDIAIGIGSVLAVIMIALYGFRYMTGEKSVHEISQLKTKIMNVVLGILLLLGIYIILNTINPNLLKVEPDVGEVSIDADEFETEDFSDNPTYSDNDLKDQIKFSDCKEFERVEGFMACKEVAVNLRNMILAARKEGVNITPGQGLRTVAEQIKFRKMYCGTSHYDIYEKPASQCRPQAARPGKSNHQDGRAFDLRCNGQKGFGGSKCFTWMKNNAAKYGFYNLKSEPWHWSVNGK
jgi:hypothetical protein